MASLFLQENVSNINLNGINIRYLKKGNNKKTIIFLHGLGGTLESLSPIFEPLSKYYSIYAFDMVGYGFSDKPRDVKYSYKYFSETLYKFMNALKIEKAILFGWSLGGGIALQFAVDNQQMVEKLILMSSGGLTRKFSILLRLMTVPILGEFLNLIKKPEKSFNPLIYDKLKIQKKWIEFAKQLNDIPGIDKTNLMTIRNTCTIRGGTDKTMFPIWNNLYKINCDTLVIWGKQDEIIPPYGAKFAKKHIENCEVFMLDKCGHAPHLEHEDKVLNKLYEFLKVLS